MIQVKICGIKDSEGLDSSVAAGADWVGFVFFPPSPRFVTPEGAASLLARHPGGPLRVGLFVEPTEAIIESVVEAVRLDALQVYGAADRLAAFRGRFGLPVWRAIGVADTTDLPVRAPDGVDRLVVEAKAPLGADRPGGHARAFDWSVLRGWRAPVAWMVAGGLTPQNVAAAIEATGAAAVDVSSGVERAKGVKDAARIHGFVAAARQAAGGRPRSDV